MKLLVEGSAEVVGWGGEVWIARDSGSREIALVSEQLSDHLDLNLADLGVIGGTNHLVLKPDQGPRLRAVYHSPVELDAESLARLVRDTEGQWEDGLGEGGFAALIDSEKVKVSYRRDQSLRAAQVHDSVHVPKPPAAAICARKGDLEGLTRALQQGEDIDRPHQGYTPLHLAILYCRLPEIRLLIDHGANVNQPDRQGQTAVELCVLSRMCDADSATIAELLVRKGGTSASFEPIRLAELAGGRRKPLTAQFLTMHLVAL